MSQHSDDLVRVGAGSLVQVNHWHDLLGTAGIESRVAGDNLTASLGTALPGYIELWVHRSNLGAAEGLIARQNGQYAHAPASRPAHGHPTDDRKPDRSRGPQHGAPPHRPLPS